MIENESSGNPGLKHTSLVDLAPRTVEPTMNDVIAAQLFARVTEKQTSPKLPKQRLGDKTVGALIEALTALNSPHARLQSITGVELLQKTDGTHFLQFTTR